VKALNRSQLALSVAAADRPVAGASPTPASTPSATASSGTSAAPPRSHRTRYYQKVAALFPPPPIVGEAQQKKAFASTTHPHHGFPSNFPPYAIGDSLGQGHGLVLKSV